MAWRHTCTQCGKDMGEKKESSLKNTREISGQCKLLTKTAQLFKVLLPGCANVADDIHYLPREVLMC